MTPEEPVSKNHKQSRDHRRVSQPLSNSPQISEASQMRDRLAVAREQLDDPSLLSRGVLSFHHDDPRRADQRVDGLSHIEDLRRIPHEKNFRPIKERHFLVSGKSAEHGYNRWSAYVPVQSGVFWLPERVRDEFYNPRQTVVCIRRQTRRRVLFALRQIGRGSGAKRRARWSETSRIVCRRR